jgi:carbamoyl-phosphate synthase large subunit
MTDFKSKISNETRNHKKVLLFTGGGGPSSEALFRLLSDRYEIHLADADIEAKPHLIPFSHWHQIPIATSPKFIEEVRKLSQDLQIDLLVPGVDEELVSLAYSKETFTCDFLLPPLDFIQSHLDKLASNQILKIRGIDVPKTELPSRRDRVSFPCVVKPRKGRGSRGFAIIHSEKELDAYLLLSRSESDNFIIQELLTGNEYTVMMLADKKGLLRAVVPVRVFLKKGITIRAETDDNENIVNACRKIHESKPVPGYYNIQLIESADGSVMPFEINPRISTTACLALASGVNFIEIYLNNNVNDGNNISDLAPFQNGLKMKRSWYNEFLGCELK